MNVVIIRYNAGNVRSVSNALDRLGINPEVSDDPEVITRADKVIFPGVGEASTAMRYLKRTGLDQVLVSLKQPVFGICLGMQVMCQHSEENDTTCLGIFDYEVRRFQPQIGAEKVPHMGWNTLLDLKSPLFEGLEGDAFAYFVHSYYVEHGDDTIATTEYGLPFSAALHRDNFYATQFHPEKSGATGSRILENFISVSTERLLV